MMKKYILFIAASVIIIVLVGLFLIKTEERTQLKMGTFVKVTLSGPRWLNFEVAFKRAFAAVDRVDAMASVYNKDSEVARLNQAAYLGPVAVSDDLFTLIRDSVKLSKDSDGAFDITVGPLVEWWRSYSNKNRFPSNNEVKRVLSLTGYDKLILDEAPKSVFYKKKGLVINLSAIAKGYAVDCAVEELKKLGFKSAIVNAGGDLYCLGRRSLFRPWRIGIADPRKKSSMAKLLYLSNKAAATSGGYEQYFTHKGKDYTHLIDPKTGYPKESRFYSVTVVAPRCVLADGIATAVAVGGEPVKDKIENLYPEVEIIIKNRP